MVWGDEILLLGHATMDHLHEDFVVCLGDLPLAPDEILPGVLDAMIEHLSVHFGDEDRWREEAGFLPRQCHMDEHGAVLQSTAEERFRLQQGDMLPCRRFADAL